MKFGKIQSQSSFVQCLELLHVRGEVNLGAPLVLGLVGKKGKSHPCTGTEALYRPYGPYAE
jgi:hypothetical protein